MSRQVDERSRSYEYRLLFKILQAYAFDEGITSIEALYDIVFEKLVGNDITFELCETLFAKAGGMGAFFHEIFEGNIGNFCGEESYHDMDDVFRVMASFSENLRVSIHGNLEQAAKFFSTFKSAARLVLDEKDLKRFRTVDENGEILFADIYDFLYSNWGKIGKRNETYRFLVCLTEMIDWSQRDYPGNRYDVLKSLRKMVDKEFYREVPITSESNDRSQEYTQ